ncbi:Hypothetical protein CINCED_3A004147 [Cinara cedri]|uniref:Uncharacterized protein n=1 Tax=Cinara cedri TaxID=506608 RepID=A0A5E4M117_9HEMI|nr:Hypothetical protein CINCED_3A004147 [Cinara cedri]
MHAAVHSRLTGIHIFVSSTQYARIFKNVRVRTKCSHACFSTGLVLVHEKPPPNRVLSRRDEMTRAHQFHSRVRFGYAVSRRMCTGGYKAVFTRSRELGESTTTRPAKMNETVSNLCSSSVQSDNTLNQLEDKDSCGLNDQIEVNLSNEKKSGQRFKLPSISSQAVQ